VYAQWRLKKKKIFKILGGKSAAVQATDVLIFIANDGT
jgi:hypothetical protein